MSVLILNSATQVITFLIMATDHLSGATGQSPTVRFSKNGATTFASATQAVTEMQYGWYKLSLATNNVDTIGELAVHATATKGDDSDEKHFVGPIPANTVWWASATVSAPAVSGVPVVDTAYFFGVSGTATTGKPGVNLMQINGTAATTNTAQLGVNVVQWATGTVATPNTTGVPKVDLISINGTTATTGAAMLGVNVYSWATATGLVTSNAPGIPKTDLIAVNGTTATTGAALLGVNVYSWATATGLVPAPSVVGRPLVDLSHIAGSAVNTAAAQIGVNVIQAATVGWNSGAIQSGTFAAEAITSSALATDCITSSELAASAVTEIQAGLSTIGYAGVASAVWDELKTTHTATNTFGAILQALGGSADPWSTPLPGAYTASQAGYIVGTNLDATVSSRLAAAGYTAPLDAAGTRAAVGLAAANLDTQLDALPTAVENADALLNRDMSAVSDTTARSPLNALRFLRNKWSLATTGVLTVYKEDDATTAWTATATGDSAATPVTGIDP